VRSLGRCADRDRHDGHVTVDIAAADMNTDCTILRGDGRQHGCGHGVLCLYPEEAGDIRVNLTQINSDSSLIAKFAAAVQANRIGTIVGTPTETRFSAPTSTTRSRISTTAPSSYSSRVRSPVAAPRSRTT
jgi:hypothetical protein